jgi:serine/threonine protein phosphatase PrpC
LVQAGTLTEADRRTHPQAHVITRAVGVADRIVVDAEAGACEDDDLFLVCSDGLTGAEQSAARNSRQFGSKRRSRRSPRICCNAHWQMARPTM